MKRGKEGTKQKVSFSLVYTQSAAEASRADEKGCYDNTAIDREKMHNSINHLQRLLRECVDIVE